MSILSPFIELFFPSKKNLVEKIQERNAEELKKDPFAKCKINSSFYERMIFSRAKDLICIKWTDVDARDEEGKPVPCEYKSAYAYSIVGAVKRGCLEMGFEQDHADQALEILSCFVPQGDIMKFNNTEGRRRGEILALLDKASEATI